MIEALASPWTPLTALVVMGGLVALAAMGYKVRYDKGRGRLEASNRSETERPEPLMPEKYARLTIDIVDRSGAHRDKMRDLREQAIEEQMRKYEEAEVAALASFKRGFSRVAAGLPSEQARRETRAFIHMTRAVLVDVKNQARKWFRTNHYYAMSEAEWDAYLRQKVETMFHLISDAFDTEWISDALSRDELKSVGESEREAFEDLISRAFCQARQASVRAYEESQEERARWSAYTMRVAGYDPYDPSACWEA